MGLGRNGRDEGKAKSTKRGNSCEPNAEQRVSLRRLDQIP